MQTDNLSDGSLLFDSRSLAPILESSQHQLLRLLRENSHIDVAITCECNAICHRIFSWMAASTENKLIWLFSRFSVSSLGLSRFSLPLSSRAALRAWAPLPIARRLSQNSRRLHLRSAEIEKRKSIPMRFSGTNRDFMKFKIVF